MFEDQPIIPPSETIIEKDPKALRDKKAREALTVAFPDFDPTPSLWTREALKSRGFTIPETDAISPEQAGIAARSLFKLSGTKIPEGTDVSALLSTKEGDKYLSAENFFGQWETRLAGVVENYAFLAGDDQADPTQFQEASQQIQQQFRTLSKPADGDPNWYFAHGNPSPHHVAFKGNEAVLIEFMYATATHNESTAKAGDWGNIYARLWPNEEAQKAYLREMVAAIGELPREQQAKELTTLRAAVAFTSVSLAHYGIRKGSSRPMAQALLERFDKHLTIIPESPSRGEENPREIPEEEFVSLVEEGRRLAVELFPQVFERIKDSFSPEQQEAGELFAREVFMVKVERETMVRADEKKKITADDLGKLELTKEDVLHLAVGVRQAIMGAQFVDPVTGKEKFTQEELSMMKQRLTLAKKLVS